MGFNSQRKSNETLMAQGMAYLGINNQLEGQEFGNSGNYVQFLRDRTNQNIIHTISQGLHLQLTRDERRVLEDFKYSILQKTAYKHPQFLGRGENGFVFLMQIGNISCAVKIPFQKKEDIMAFSHTVIALSCVSNIEHIPKLVGILPEEEIIFMTIIPGISLQNLSTLDTYFSNRSILQICRLIQSVHAQKLELDNGNSGNIIFNLESQTFGIIDFRYNKQPRPLYHEIAGALQHIGGKKYANSLGDYERYFLFKIRVLQLLKAKAPDLFYLLTSSSQGDIFGESDINIIKYLEQEDICTDYSSLHALRSLEILLQRKD